jgi:DNA polymerase (family 10)
VASETNQAAAATLETYASLLDLSGGNPFRVRAFRRAAETIRDLKTSLIDINAAGGLQALPGVGAGIAEALDELLRQGRFSPLEELSREWPVALLELLAIEGLGPKTAAKLHRDYGVNDLESLRAAAESGRLSEAGRGIETTVAMGLASLQRRSGRHLLGAALPLARQAAADIRADRPGAEVSLAGSVRRMVETVADIDVLVVDEDIETALADITRLPIITSVTERSSGRLRVLFRGGIAGDIVVVPPAEAGSALVRLTGNDAHLVLLGALAAARTEAEVYCERGVPFVPPELREGLDELQPTGASRLASLVEAVDIRGEFHSHTTWSDGTASVAEMARAAAERGYAFLGISDHSHSLGVARGLTGERLAAQRREISETQRETSLRLFTSSEVEVSREGDLDFDDIVLEGLDVVIASLHVGLRRPRPELMQRLRGVLENRHVDIVAHPSGRLIERRDGGDFDWNEAFRLAARTGTALEINADPTRLDLNGELARQAIDAGCLLTINCDAHHPDGFTSMEYGVAMARRAGAARASIVNCWTIAEIEAWLRDRRRPGAPGRGPVPASRPLGGKPRFLQLDPFLPQQLTNLARENVVPLHTS